MLYDYIIIGSGVAGNVCAYMLAKAGKTCLILEKTAARSEKICGGGIPYKALKMLVDIGMDVEQLWKQDVSIIRGDKCIYCKNREEETSYLADNFAMGSTRKIFDDFLLNEAINEGAEIKYNQKVSSYNKNGSYFFVNGFHAKKIIVAIGARGFEDKFHAGQSIGMSMQFKGKTKLEKDLFRYWYIEDTTKYAWLFPIGSEKWNFGVWYQNPDKDMKQYFDKYKEMIINKYFLGKIDVINTPRAEFLGNVDLRIDGNAYGVGDYAGVNNILNGGGIYRSIKQSIKLCLELEGLKL